MPLTRLLSYAAFVLFSTGWIFVLYLSAACFYAEVDGALYGTVTSFPLADFGIQLGVLGAILVRSRDGDPRGAVDSGIKEEWNLNLHLLD